MWRASTRALPAEACTLAEEEAGAGEGILVKMEADIVERVGVWGTEGDGGPVDSEDGRSVVNWDDCRRGCALMLGLLADVRCDVFVLREG